MERGLNRWYLAMTRSEMGERFEINSPNRSRSRPASGSDIESASPYVYTLPLYFDQWCEDSKFDDILVGVECSVMDNGIHGIE